MVTNVLIVVSLIAFYFVINAIIIKVFSRKQDSLEEYGVGDRSFGWFLNAFSYIGGWYNGSLYCGWFANAATLGVFAQYVLIYSITTLFFMFLMAKPVWILGKVYGLETQGDLIELRYGSKKFKFVFAFFSFIFWIPWLVLEMKTLGYVVQAATYHSINFNIGLIVASAFVIGYSFLGGARASAVGNLVQGLTFTIVGVLAVYYLIVKAFGGLADLYYVVEKDLPQLLTLGEGLDGRTWASILITCTLGGYSLPGIFTTMYRADSSRAVKKTVLVAPIFGFMIGFMLLALGLGGTLIPGFPEDPQAGVFFLADKIGGPVMLGLIGILAIAACLSTISAVINVASVLISKDLVGTAIPKLDRKSLLKWAKILTIGIGIISIFVAMQDIPNLMFIALVMYDCSVQVFPAIFLGLFWKRINFPGASAGFAVGCFFSIFGNLFPAMVAFGGGWSAGIVGLMFNLVIIIVCAFVFKPYAKVDELFDTVKNYRETYSSKLM